MFVARRCRSRVRISLRKLRSTVLGGVQIQLEPLMPQFGICNLVPPLVVLAIITDLTALDSTYSDFSSYN